MAKYVVYSNDEETIVSTLDEEHIVLKEYFMEGGRELEDYDRSESNGPVSITSRLSVSRF